MWKKLVALKQKINPNSQKIIGNTAWLLGDKFLRMGFGLLIGVWVARYLGPEKFGLLNYAIAFVSLFNVFARLGLNKIVVRDLVRKPSEKGEILGTSFMLKLLGSLFLFILTVGLIYLLRPDKIQTRILVAIIAIGMIFRSFDVIELWFQSQVQSKYIIWAKTSGYLLINLIKVTAIKNQAPLIIFAIIWSGEFALAALGLIIIYQWQGYLLKAWSWSFQRAKLLLKESWPLIFSQLVIMVYLRTDQIMLGEMIGESAVGIYAAITRLSEMLYLIPNTFVQSIFPTIIKAQETSKELYYQKQQKLFSIVTAMNYAFAIPITFISTSIVTLIYGENYAPGGAVFAVHVWSGLFVSLGVARTPCLIAEGLTKFSAATTAIGAVVNIILNYFLIIKYGIMGAAISTIICQIIASYASHIIYPKTRRIFMEQTKALLLMGFWKN